MKEIENQKEERMQQMAFYAEMFRMFKKERSNPQSENLYNKMVEVVEVV
jgi:hypothetical protein